jgi:Holliday junction resolvase
VRLKGKVDSNQAAIVSELRERGYLVLSLASHGRGIPDLLIFDGDRLSLIEVKSKEGKLTPDQERFQAQGWPVVVVRSELDLEEFINS